MVGSKETCSFTQTEGLSPEISCEMGRNRSYLLHLPLDDANIDQALFGPPFYRDIVQESTELFTLFHLVEKTTGYTGRGRVVLTTVSDGV